MKYIVNLKLILETTVLLLFSQSALADNNTSQIIETEYYRVQDGNIDADTFVGYSVFHNACVGCHGVGGAGSDVAPDLVKSLEYLGADQFRMKVLHKFAIKFSRDEWADLEQSMFEEILKQEHRDQGELANMPRWEYNPMVTKHVQNIYRYLKARADGVIDAGKPGLLKD